METQTAGLVQNDEGVSETAAAPEVQPTDEQLAAAAGIIGEGREALSPNSDVPPEPEPPAGDAAGTPQVGDDSAQEPSQPTGPPPGYEGVAPELWPDKDGNPPQLTETLMRTLRRKYFTVRHPQLEQCGHKLDMIAQPKNNCEICWWHFYNTHPQLVEVADQFFRTHGKNAMVSMRGVKFVKNFLRYMATVIHLMKEEGRLPSEPRNQEGGDAGSVDSRTSKVGETGSPIGTVDQGTEAEGGRISSGLHESTV